MKDLIVLAFFVAGYAFIFWFFALGPAERLVDKYLRRLFDYFGLEKPQ